MKRVQFAGRLTAACLALVLAACQSTGVPGGAGSIPQGSPATPDAAVPSVAAAALPAGARAGRVIGGIDRAGVAKAVNPDDLAAGVAAEYLALQTVAAGKQHQWVGPRGGQGTVVPGEVYQYNSLQCRDFTHRFTAGAGPQILRGTACLHGDGYWRAVTS
jgi:surface antigen